MKIVLTSGCILAVSLLGGMPALAQQRPRLCVYSESRSECPTGAHKMQVDEFNAYHWATSAVRVGDPRDRTRGQRRSPGAH